MSQALFRQQALDHQSERYRGSLILSQPVSYTLCTVGVICIVLLALCFLLTNTYHRKVVIQGRLVPDKGLVSVLSPGSGRIIAVHAKQDEPVDGGQALFDVQLDESSGGGGPFSVQLLDNLDDREARLTARLHVIDARQRLSLKSGAGHRDAIHASIEELEALVDNANALLDLKSAALRRAEVLHLRSVIAAGDLDAVRAEFLLQENTLANLNLRLLEARRELADEQWSRRATVLSEREARLRIENDLALLRQERIRLLAGIRNQVLSPVSGVVAAVHGKAGEFVDTRREIIAIIPEGAVLQAEFFVPSDAVGFLAEGQEVHLRFDAFPYQKFGVYAAIIDHVSNSALLTDNAEASGYRVVARLRSQYVRAYGEEVLLKPGMMLAANVTLDERSLFEWLMEPLYSVAGKR